MTSNGIVAPAFLQADSSSGVGSARDRAYQTLKRRLITLELTPGDALDLGALSRELELGRTPLIEAIQRLAQEDLLAVHPRRGTIVTQPSLSQVRYVLEVRDTYEARAARLAAYRRSDAQLRELEELLDRQLHDRDLDDHARFLLHDYRMHLAVATISGNPLLIRALDHLLALNMRLWFVFFRIHDPQARYLFSHQPIFEAVAHRDPDAAEAAALAHVKECNEVLVTMFQDPL